MNAQKFGFSGRTTKLEIVGDTVLGVEISNGGQAGRSLDNGRHGDELGQRKWT